MDKIKAFTLRKKVSKAGKIYFTSPFGEVDLLAFQKESGDIEVFYSSRTPRPVQGAYAAPQQQAPQTGIKPKIIPRSPPQRIIPREAPHHRPQPIPQDYVDHTVPDMGTDFERLEKSWDEEDPGPTMEDLPY